MKAQRKLKRGLADLSNFFAQPISTQQKNRKGFLTIEAPECPVSQSFPKPSLITASVASFSPSFQISDLIEFTEAIKFSFSNVHFVSVTTQENSFQYHIAGREIHYEKISWTQLKPFVQPQMRPRFLPPEEDADKALVIFDSVFDLAENRSLFELLDHCVFAVEADAKQLMQVYQTMKLALSINPNLHHSLLLAGSGAERFSEFIYERFSNIISHFLGHDLGFIGWMENHEICVNADLLKEDSGSASVHCSKIQLADLLYQSQPITSL